MKTHGFKCRGIAALRWLAPLVAVLLAVVVSIAFVEAVQRWPGGGTAVVKDQTRMELQP